jgi:tetratricopeptide (TPR) repeat protein
MLTVTTLRIPYAPIGDEDPLPVVGRMLEPPYELADDVPEPIRSGASFGRPRSLFPYLMQNRYGRQRRLADLRCVVLENEHLRARFLPELGGRMWSLVDLATGRELLYSNRAVQPANLALRNAWFAGGVEWNIGTRGHSPHTASPLHTGYLTARDGTPVLRMWEFERLRGVVYQVDAWLPPRSRALYVHVRIRNPNAHAVPMYWWSNTAVPERDDVRVLVPANRAYATSYDGTVRVVDIPGPASGDRTWPARSPHSADHFFDLATSGRPWIAAVDGSGRGLGQTSTRRLVGRKLFCWGAGRGGRRWQEWLSPEGGRYLEIQAGLAATQYEHVLMPAGATWSWVEAYGPIEANAAICHGADWAAATAHVQERIQALAPDDELDDQMARATAFADQAPEEMVCAGSGWGALERQVRQRVGAAWLDETGTPFPAGTMGPQQEVWRDLLRDGAGTVLADADPRVPPSSYVAGEVWDALLAGAKPSWARDYHLAVRAHAAGDLATARRHYRASLDRQRSAWALRGLALVAAEQNDHGTARDLLRAAVDIAPEQLSLRYEAVGAALQAGDAAAALDLVDSAPPSQSGQGRLPLLEVQAALAAGDTARAARLLDSGIEVPDVREGEISLAALWQRAHPGRPVPAAYDFRMRG